MKADAQSTIGKTVAVIWLHRNIVAEADRLCGEGRECRIEFGLGTVANVEPKLSLTSNVERKLSHVFV